MNANVLLLCTLITEMLAARQFPHCQRNCFFFVFTWSSCIDLVYRSTPTGVIFPKRFCFQWNMLYFSLKRKRTGLRMLKNLANFLSSLFVICITLFHSCSFLVYHCHLCVLSILPSQENVSFFFSPLMKMWFSAAQKWLKRSPGEKKDRRW